MAATATERKLLIDGEWVETGAWIDVRPADEAVHDLRREVVSADVRERPVPPPDRAADGVHDQRI